VGREATTELLVGLGGAVGAPLRYLTDRVLRGRAARSGVDPVFPRGTLVVNLSGAFVLGLLAGLPTDPRTVALVGTGLCGALTTYSTFSYETLCLARNGRRGLALANVALTLLAGMTAGIAGLLVARWVTG
jgi:CrcB protein